MGRLYWNEREKMVGRYGLHTSVPGLGPGEHGNEPSGSIKGGEYPD
jgi:hypothetical protein